MIKEKERGSVTIEACIIVPIFMMAITLIYSLVSIVILENILQTAANNMAGEISAYVYIFDRAGLVFDSGKELELDGVIDSVIESQQSLDTLQGSGSADEFIKNGTGVIENGKNLISTVKNTDWKNALLETVKDAGKSGVKAIGNALLENGFYRSMLPAYLPADIEAFKKFYRIKGDINFDNSQFLSDDLSIVVRINCEVETPFSHFFGIGTRKISKTAVAAAWISNNTH